METLTGGVWTMMEGAELPESMRGYHVQTATSSDGGGASAQTLEVVGRLERDRPVPVPSEVRVTGGYVALVRVLIAGICNTDIEIMRGYMGFNGILGHEFVGYVVGVAPLQKPTAKADANARSWIGKRVVGDINCACTSCGICVRAKGEDARCTLARGDGEPRHFLNEVQAMARNHCPKRRVLGILSKDGTYADWLCLPLENLHEIPEEISSVNAAFVEPLAAAYRIVEQGVLLTEASSVGGVDTRVAVLGDGKLGLLIAEVVGRHLNADSAGPPRVDIIGRHMEKMRLLSKEANVRTLLEGDVRARHEEFFKSYDVVIDATGHQSGLVLSTDLVRCLGTVCLKSTCAVDNKPKNGTPFNTAAYVINEVKVVGSRCGPMEPAIKLLKDGLDLERFVTATFDLDHVEEALEVAGRKGALKVQIRVSTFGNNW